ncbi:hypothetical protein OJF2_29790 [Aquisphaera giovannonii]|uniref:Bacterial membrane protein YfhO n=1 Tax=Aquisphaera giovannonii TaxID=406548 RepID=A0A5B9W3C0_9BACT|nr:hypothetical protein [Aquisphaera giovannonii]QEH34440.1 hypothetical protein OJF2_29790 [Aquisphaera giovannonii]
MRRGARDGLLRVGRRAARVVRRWPKTGLIAGAMLVFLAPLGWDLLRAIPWEIQKGFGWVVFGCGMMIALARLLEVRDADDLPPIDGPPAAEGFARCLPYLLAATALAMAWPMLGHPENLGFGDWDYYLGKHEAIRRTILEYGEFPWWDPWTRGGFPLAASPQCGLVSVHMPFVLLLGTTAGMGIGTAICMALACEGARRLARLWIVDPWASAAAGLIYGLNGAILVSAVAGYHVVMAYPALPWMLYHLARLGRRPIDAVGLGFWTAFGILNGIQYFETYSVLIAGVVWLRALRARDGRSRFLGQTVLALGVFLLLTGWRLGTAGLVYRDFPRVLRSSFLSPLDSVPDRLLARFPAEVLRVMENPHAWEFARYVGPVVPLLALASLLRGWRWWHTLTLLTGWLSLGSWEWYHPSYWLGHWPVFSTMHVVTRWQYMTALGVAMAAAATIARIRTSPNRVVRGLAIAAIAAIAADYVGYGFEVLPVAFGVRPDESAYPGPALPRGEIIQVAEIGGYPAASRGYGVVFGYEPLLGYDRRSPTARLWRGHPGYAGEFSTAAGPVRPESWSPNRIELRVRPGEAVTINQNPGSWWLINGRRAFPDDRCVEKERPFVALADGDGRIDLRISPRGLAAGLWLHAAGAAIVASFLAASLARRRLPTPVAATSEPG